MRLMGRQFIPLAITILSIRAGIGVQQQKDRAKKTGKFANSAWHEYCLSVLSFHSVSLRHPTCLERTASPSKTVGTTIWFGWFFDLILVESGEKNLAKIPTTGSFKYKNRLLEAPGYRFNIDTDYDAPEIKAETINRESQEAKFLSFQPTVFLSAKSRCGQEQRADYNKNSHQLSLDLQYHVIIMVLDQYMLPAGKRIRRLMA